MKKNKKTLLCLLSAIMSVVLLFSITACNKDDDGKENTTKIAALTPNDVFLKYTSEEETYSIAEASQLKDANFSTIDSYGTAIVTKTTTVGIMNTEYSGLYNFVSNTFILPLNSKYSIYSSSTSSNLKFYVVAINNSESSAPTTYKVYSPFGFVCDVVSAYPSIYTSSIGNYDYYVKVDNLAFYLNTKTGLLTEIDYSLSLHVTSDVGIESTNYYFSAITDTKFVLFSKSTKLLVKEINISEIIDSNTDVSASAFLNNENMIFQTSKLLLDDATDYDYLQYNSTTKDYSKYELKTYIINTTDGTISEKDFDLKISTVYNINSGYINYFDKLYKVENIFIASEIDENKMLKNNEIYACKADLTIDGVLKGFLSSYSSSLPIMIGDDLIVSTSYSSNLYYNLSGNIIASSASGTIDGNYFVVGKNIFNQKTLAKVYTILSNETLIDIYGDNILTSRKEVETSSSSVLNSSVLNAETKTVYYINNKKIDNYYVNSSNSTLLTYNLYQTRTFDAETSEYTYSLYKVDGTKIYDSATLFEIAYSNNKTAVISNEIAVIDPLTSLSTYSTNYYVANKTNPDNSI